LCKKEKVSDAHEEWSQQSQSTSSLEGPQQQGWPNFLTSKTCPFIVLGQPKPLVEPFLPHSPNKKIGFPVFRSPHLLMFFDFPILFKAKY
jgi:hypothetical protein